MPLIWMTLAFASEPKVVYIEFDPEPIDLCRELLLGCDQPWPHAHDFLRIRYDWDDEVEESTLFVDARPTGVPRRHRGWR